MNGDLSLVLDAATVHGSAAVLRGLEVAAAREVLMRADDEERLMPAVAACCDEAGAVPRELARVICGEGPGSFTSLRIAASIAKGVAMAAGCPLFAVSSLVLSVAAAAPALPSARYLSVLDAHRGELFVLLVEVDEGGEIRAAGQLMIRTPEAVRDLAAIEGARIVGPGQEIESRPSAAAVAMLLPEIIGGGPVDLISWEPVYGRAPEAQVRWERAHGRALAP